VQTIITLELNKYSFTKASEFCTCLYEQIIQHSTASIRPLQALHNQMLFPPLTELKWSVQQYSLLRFFIFLNRLLSFSSQHPSLSLLLIEAIQPKAFVCARHLAHLSACVFKHGYRLYSFAHLSRYTLQFTIRGFYIYKGQNEWRW